MSNFVTIWNNGSCNRNRSMMLIAAFLSRSIAIPQSQRIVRSDNFRCFIDHNYNTFSWWAIHRILLLFYLLSVPCRLETGQIVPSTPYSAMNDAKPSLLCSVVDTPHFDDLALQGYWYVAFRKLPKISGLREQSQPSRVKKLPRCEMDNNLARTLVFKYSNEIRYCTRYFGEDLWIRQ